MWPVFVINLPGAVNRRHLCQAILEKCGIAATFVAAVDGQILDQQHVAAYYNDQENRASFKRPMSRPEIGCYLSHLALWSEIATSDADGAFIFEDDFRPLDIDHFSKAVARIPELVSRDDIVKLHCAKPILGREFSKLTERHRLIDAWIAPPFTTGYALTRSAAEALARTAVPFSRPVDIDMKRWWKSGLRILAVQPPLVGVHQGFDSAIQNARQAFVRQQSKVQRFRRNLRYQAQFHTELTVALARRAMSLRTPHDFGGRTDNQFAPPVVRIGRTCQKDIAAQDNPGAGIFDVHLEFHNHGGSVEHYYHFVLGLLIPLLNCVEDEASRARRVYVRSCAVMDRHLHDLAYLPLTILDRQEHAELGRIRMSEDRIRLRHLLFTGFDTPAYYDQAIFKQAALRLRARLSPEISIAQRAIVESWPAEGPRILLIDRGPPNPYQSVESETRDSGRHRRSIANIDKLFAALRGAYPNVCLEFLEDKPLAHQIALFGMADVVIAQHGAALTNLLWARDGVLSVEIFPNDLRKRTRKLEHYAKLARCLGQKVEKVAQAHRHSEVNVNDVVSAVNRLLSGGAAATRTATEAFAPKTAAARQRRQLHTRDCA